MIFWKGVPLKGLSDAQLEEACIATGRNEDKSAAVFLAEWTARRAAELSLNLSERIDRAYEQGRDDEREVHLP